MYKVRAKFVLERMNSKEILILSLLQQENCHCIGFPVRTLLMEFLV